MMQSVSLRQLNQMVSVAVTGIFPEGIWVTAEINSLQDRGHCYLELIEKDIDTEQIVAKASATIWRNIYVKLRMEFVKATGSQFTAGIKVLAMVRPTFHPQYGYSLNITDIDPSYTIGDAALKRAAVVRQLKEDGVYELNKELPIPVLIRRIALISSPTAAGYGDFMNQLATNVYGYKYDVALFEAIMQGENAEASIVEALDKVAADYMRYDVVVIVRGGGAVSDLNCFDRYGIASSVAQFPIPVLTGIGHDRDTSVVDEVAAVRFKTPTAVAAYIVDSTYMAEQRLLDALQQFDNAVRMYIQRNTQIVESLTVGVISSSNQMLERCRGRVDVLWAGFVSAVSSFITGHTHHLAMIEKEIELSSPSNILKKGYSMTLKNGVVTSAAMVEKGDILETVFYDGSINSVVKI